MTIARRETDIYAQPNWFQRTRLANSRQSPRCHFKDPRAASEAQRERALQDLFRASHGRFVLIAYRILRNREDAEDAVQDAFLSASRCMREFQGRSSLATWFTRIVMNAALMVRRKRENRALRPLHEFGAEHSLLDKTIADVQPNPESAYSQAESFEFVDALIGKLNPLLREAITMTYYQELSACEASSVLGIPLSTFKARLFRGRRLLQQNAEDITVG